MHRYIQRTLIILCCASALGACSPSQSVEKSARAPVAKTEPLPGLQIVQLRPGVWVHTSHYRFPDGAVYPSNGLIVQEGEHLLLIDPAWGAEATEELLARIDGEIGLPVTRAISTHFHDDRTAGVDVLAEAGVDVYAHPMTQTLSASHANPVPRIALPELAAVGGSVALGSVEVFYPGPGHARDNIIVWLPAQKILYGGCAIREMATDTLGNTTDADVAAWPASVRRVKERYPQTQLVVPGHGEVGGAELLSHTIGLF